VSGVLTVFVPFITEIAGQVPGIAGADFTKKVFLTSESRAFILSRDVIFL
jgi:hypothetical protein